MSIEANARSIWDRLQGSPTVLPTHVPIPQERVLCSETRLREPFSPDSHYFQVRINEMFLSQQRQWFSKFDPFVYVLSQFTYDKAEETVPFIVGPQLLEKTANPMRVPTGTLFTNTRVAGIHPYRGGRVVLALALCQLQRENYARTVLSMVEKAAGALDFSNVLSSYLKVSGVILDGLEALLGVGATKPLIGMRIEFDPDAGDLFEPCHWLLIDLPSSALPEDRLWVKDGRLKYGPSSSDLSDFHEADYVLFSVVQSATRGDIRTLPFYPLFETALKEASSPEADSWQRAKAGLSALYQQLILSADLTPSHGDALNDQFVARLKLVRKHVLQNATLGGQDQLPASVSQRLSLAARLLDLE